MVADRMVPQHAMTAHDAVMALMVGDGNRALDMRCVGRRVDGDLCSAAALLLCWATSGEVTTARPTGDAVKSVMAFLLLANS
jgi:hypothetical protein